MEGENHILNFYNSPSDNSPKTYNNNPDTETTSEGNILFQYSSNGRKLDQENIELETVFNGKPQEGQETAYTYIQKFQCPGDRLLKLRICGNCII